MKKLIVFDLDGTLTESKVELSAEMAELMRKLLARYEVAVTSGAAFERFQTQLIDPLRASVEELKNLHILPTNGTNYFRYDLDRSAWTEIYADEIPAAAKASIAAIIEQTAKQLGYWEPQPAGEIIEDRVSQMTFSALGQQAKLGEKQSWDPDGIKRARLRAALIPKLPDYAVHTAGLTSIDVTLQGVDKATAITKLKDVLGLERDQVVYVGDALAPGGNDEVVKLAGYDVIKVKGPEDTARQIEGLIEAATLDTKN